MNRGNKEKATTVYLIPRLHLKSNSENVNIRRVYFTITQGQESELTFVKLLRGIFEISLRTGIKPDTEEKQAGCTTSNRKEQSGYVICVMSGFMFFFKLQILERIYKYPGNNRLGYVAVLDYKKS